jgi:glycosyltransferase involved in cell wall biosynthesis
MNVNIFIFCYNESVLLPKTVSHYKKNIPSCTITIYDNESTDNSVEIAKALGCNVISWSSNNIVDDIKLRGYKNGIWKDVKDGWIIVVDMDEWLCITEEELKEEKEKGATLIKVFGINIIGESKTLDLSDVNLDDIDKYEDTNSSIWLCKKVCFLRESIIDMNYYIGAHTCEPNGIIKFSEQIYIMKHMSNLGENFIIDKIIKRYERSEKMRNFNMCSHYTNDIEKIKQDYHYLLMNSKSLSKICLSEVKHLYWVNNCI